MKKNLKEFSAKSDEDLKELLKTKREELFNLSLDKQQNKLKNTRILFNTRKDIARILTIIRERELSSEKSGEVKK